MAVYLSRSFRAQFGVFQSIKMWQPVPAKLPLLSCGRAYHSQCASEEGYLHYFIRRINLLRDTVHPGPSQDFNSMMWHFQAHIVTAAMGSLWALPFFSADFILSMVHGRCVVCSFSDSPMDFTKETSSHSAKPIVPIRCLDSDHEVRWRCISRSTFDNSGFPSPTIFARWMACTFGNQLICMYNDFILSHELSCSNTRAPWMCPPLGFSMWWRDQLDVAQRHFHRDSNL